MRPRDFQDILSKLPSARKSGDTWTAPCPLSGHKTPAGHVTLKDAGDKALITCQGGKHTYRDYCETWGYDSLTYSSSDKGAEAKIIATYDYTDAAGKLLYQVVRFEPKEFRQRRPNGKGAWAWNLKGVKPVLYRLPEVLKAVREGQAVYICEGEKDTDALRLEGLTATTNSGGAGKWRADYAEALAGTSVIILPDRDAPGQRHSAKVATSLHGKAKSIKIVELTDRDSHQIKDVSDWLAAGGTVAELEHLASETPEWEPSPQEVKLLCMAGVKAEKVDWLWKPYIPKGKVTLVEGDPGIGKSTATLGIATGVTLGRGIPGQEPTKPSNVVIASAEDGLGDTIRPRLDAMGADVSRIFAIDGALTLDEHGFILLESYLEKIRPVLLIIDPLVAYLGAGVDIHRANETRAVMSRLARLAERFGVAIIAIRHLTKGSMSKAIYRGLGSIDFTAACRSVLLAGCDIENPQNRALVHIKSNLAPAGPAIGYELRDGGFYWTGESTLTAVQLLAAESTTGISELDETRTFLKDVLAGGEVPAKDIYQAAKDAGIAKRTLERAKAKLQAKSRKIGDTWFWCLTSPTSPYREFGELGNIAAKKEVAMEGPSDLNLEAILGMPIAQAIELWRSEGAPLIHLGPGENCLDLEKLLSNRNIKPEHSDAVRVWLEKVLKRRGES
jgi:5S rRNA maturation endonuclease (ribonuclease M5)